MKKIVSMVVLCAVLLGAMAGMTGCSDKIVLNVFNWGEYIDESLIDRFEDETGIKVNYKTYDTNETLLAKLEAGGVSYDVVFPSDYAIAEMIKRDMLLPIDFNNIPNFKYIDDRFKNMDYDPDNLSAEQATLKLEKERDDAKLLQRLEEEERHRKNQEAIKKFSKHGKRSDWYDPNDPAHPQE